MRWLLLVLLLLPGCYSSHQQENRIGMFIGALLFLGCAWQARHNASSERVQEEPDLALAAFWDLACFLEVCAAIYMGICSWS